MKREVEGFFPPLSCLTLFYLFHLSLYRVSSLVCLVLSLASPRSPCLPTHHIERHSQPRVTPYVSPRPRLTQDRTYVEVLVAEEAGCGALDAIDILADSIEELILLVAHYLVP